MVLLGRNNMRHLLLAATICSTIVVSAGGGARATETYANARFGYTICYPENLLIPQRESENGDGRKFVAKDGAELAVWGQYNVQGTLGEVMADRISWVQKDGGAVTYQAAKKTWFVISGEEGGKVFYHRTIVGRGDLLISFRLTYSRDLAARYDPIIRQLSQCMHE